MEYDEIINNDSNIPKVMKDNPIIREICRAGQYLSEKLSELNCPDHIIGRITFTAGQLCFGKPDPWEIHQEILNEFINNTLEFEEDLDLN